MNARIKAGVFTMVSLGVVFQDPIWAGAELLPATEQGNVILRSFDKWNLPGLPIQVGHAGILGGWNGDDPSNALNFHVFDEGTINEQEPDTSNFPNIPNCTINERTFRRFTEINTLRFIPAIDYGGGFTAFPGNLIGAYPIQ